MSRKYRIDMRGTRHGRLMGVAYSHTSPGNGRAHWEFLCDCGTTTVADGGHVRAGRTASCGCLHREVSAQRLTVHGHRAAARHEPTYRAWQQARRAGPGAQPSAGVAPSVGIGPNALASMAFTVFLATVGERPAGTVLRTKKNGLKRAQSGVWIAREDRQKRARNGWQKRRPEDGHNQSSGQPQDDGWVAGSSGPWLTTVRNAL